MSDNPSSPLLVALISSGCCDPAIDLDAPDVGHLLTAYERSRSDKDRDALPVRPGQRLTLYQVQALTPRQYAGVLRCSTSEPFDSLGGYRSDPIRDQFAVSVACHLYRRADGIERTARTKTVGPYTTADDRWLDELAGAGFDMFAELASVIVTRAKVRPGTLDPFELPAGLRLSR